MRQEFSGQNTAKEWLRTSDGEIGKPQEVQGHRIILKWTRTTDEQTMYEFREPSAPESSQTIPTVLQISDVVIGEICALESLYSNAIRLTQKVHCDKSWPEDISGAAYWRGYHKK